MMNSSIVRPAEASRLRQIRPEYDGDLVASLPLELLLQIVEYLDPADIVRSQRVSKRWHTIFSSETVVMCSLNQTLAILGLDSKDVAADDAMTYFRWRHGLECARPVKKAFVPYSESMKGRGQFVYHSRRLCYGTFDSNGVGMIDLETGEISEWIDEMDEVEAQEFHYWDFFLSESYLVMMRQDIPPHCGQYGIYTHHKDALENSLAFLKGFGS